MKRQKLTKYIPGWLAFSIRERHAGAGIGNAGFIE